MTNPDEIANRTFDEIEPGQSAQQERTLTEDDIALFAALSGDIDPGAVDEDFSREGIQSRVIGHGMWGSTLVANLLGTQLPGPGTILCEQRLRFDAPIGAGDTVTVTVTARDKHPDRHVVEFDCLGINQLGRTVLSGTAEVIAPTVKLRRRRGPAPEIRFRRRGGYERLMTYCRKLEPVTTAVAHPCDESALIATVEAAHEGIIIPILVGPPAKIRDVAGRCRLDISGFELVEAEHSHAAAAKAVELIRSGRAEVLMKGSLHTDELMAAAVAKSTGLRTERRISHAFIMDVATHSDVLMVTDAAINIFPTLEDKRDICQNAIDLAHALGIEMPKVAILSAVETVTGRIPSTLVAASLCKMADRGQITGGLLDGPLAFDNAISKEAARIKGIKSPVAGQANILVVPDLEAGNILAKQLTFMTKADAAGIVLGARVPIVLTSRADSQRTRLASAAIGAILTHHRRGTLAGTVRGDMA